MKRLWINLGIVAGTILFLYLYIGSQDVRRNSVSANTKRGYGLSHFYKQVQRLGQSDVETIRRAILNQQSLDGIDSLFIISPLRKISSFEGKKLRAYVEQGGKLFMSFHTNQHYFNLVTLLRELDIETSYDNNSSFENRQVELISPQSETALLDPKESYAFYSPVILNDANCRLLHFECFFQQREYGQGQIVIAAGFPPFNNAMLQHGNNVELTARIIKWAGRLGLDEYHQLYAEKTWGDLIMTPSVSLPIAGLLTIILAYFLMGVPPGKQKVARQEVKPPLTYHELNTMAIQSQLSFADLRAQATQTHEQFLLRRHPEFAHLIREASQNANDPKAKRAYLLKAHKVILQKLGKV